METTAAPLAHRRDGTLRNAAGTLRDPVLQQPCQTRHGQESQCGADPADVASPAGIRDNSPDHRYAGAHGRDDVANPVNEIQERAFRLRPGLTLNRYVWLRSSAEILIESHGLAYHQKADCQHHGRYTYVLHLRETSIGILPFAAATAGS